VLIDDTCTVRLLDPTTGNISPLSHFPQQSGDCTKASPSSFSSNFDRMALAAGRAGIGWYDSSGRLIVVGHQRTHTPDFGDPVVVDSVGFDRLDNFYYSVDTGGDYRLWRVPKGSTGDGTQLPDQGTISDVSLDADGTLGLTTKQPDCKDYSGAGQLDPTKTVYYYEVSNLPGSGPVSGDIIFRASNWCATDQKDPVTPKANFGILSFAVSPDGSTLAVQGDNNKVYLMGTQGGEPARWTFRIWGRTAHMAGAPAVGSESVGVPVTPVAAGDLDLATRAAS
jgi:WD40 repeat protein